ncbi:MAG TPA: hypothetical protein VEY91_08595 [Candidatus Limnocylindria bacterium]|nr:hypothetical protein [Candidatus Limnocylindria bacterium]
MMQVRARAVLAAGLAVHLALAARLLDGLPSGPRVALAFAVLVLLPGAGWCALGARPRGGGPIVSSWALGLGIAWNALLLLVTRMLDVPFTALLTWTPATTLVPWALAAWRARKEPETRPSEPRSSRAGSGSALVLGRGAIFLVVVAAALAALHSARFGTPLSYYSDSPDHVGTIRRMLQSGDLFPHDAFFKDAGPTGADPRKGLWHGQVAWISRLAAADPAETWRDLSACIAPLFVMTAAGLGFLVRGNAGAVIAAWALLLTYGGSLAGGELREGVYATKLADQLSLATAIAVLADLARPAWSLRLAAAGLGFAAVTTHVFAALQFALVFSALALGLLVRDRRFSSVVRRLLGTAAAIAVACLPFFLWRMRMAYAPTNIIHTESQGLMRVAGSLDVVSIGVLWEWLGILWMIVPLSWWPLWRWGRQNPAVLYLLTSSLAVALVMFNPLAIGWLEPRLGYLLMRMIWIVPLAGLLAWALPELIARLRAGPVAARRLPAVALAGILVLAAPALGQAIEVLLHPRPHLNAEAADNALRWRPMMRWMDDRLPAGQVVLSDPATSYAVPMLSRHYVVTLLDQHSSPSDSLALRRILDARDALDPFGSWQRMREVVDRYDVDLVLLNGTFRVTPQLDYWGPGPEWHAAARARLESAPATFERLVALDGLTLYRVRREALDTLASLPPERSFVLPFVAGHFPIARRIEEGRPVLHRLGLSPRILAPGDTLNGVADWRALEPQEPGAYRVAVRFDRALPGGLDPPAALAKPVRKLLERARGERYRFRADHLPAGGRYAVDAWRPDQVVRDSFQVVVPRDVAEGRYQVQIKMLREPHYMNYRLSDYFSDRDYYTGETVGIIDVRRTPARTDAATSSGRDSTVRISPHGRLAPPSGGH